MRHFVICLLGIGTAVLATADLAAAAAPSRLAPAHAETLTPAFKRTWRKPVLHRPNFTYYKPVKKRGLLRMLSFNK
jgi:hypothetical protein